MTDIQALKPSQLVARMGPKLYLPGAMHKLEFELAAAILIHWYAANGDEFQPVKWKKVVEFLKEKYESGEWKKLLLNPFGRPDFVGLMDSEYGVRSEVMDTVGLTTKGIEAAAKSLKVNES